MKNVCKYLMFFLFIICPMTVNALDNGITLTCPENADANNTITCTINGNSSEEVTKFTASVTISSGASILSFASDNIWEGGLNENNISLTTDSAINGTVNIGTLTIKILEDTSVNSVTLSVTNAFYNDLVELSDVESHINMNLPVVLEKGLSSIQVVGGTLTRPFDGSDLDNTSYVIMLNSSDISSFRINATAKTASDNIVVEKQTESENVTISLQNDITFETYGGNDTMSILISVGEGDRLVQYQINVARPKPVSIDVPKLVSLTVGGENIDLVDGVYEYSVTLDDNESYLVEATINDNDNYMFNDFLVPPKEISGKEFTLTIVPKDASSGLETVVYTVTVNANVIEPVINPTTTSSGGGGGNPQTGSSSMYIVLIMLIVSLAASMYIYKKNINSY